MLKKISVLIGVLSAQLTIAGLYAWSIFGIAIEQETGWSSDSVFLTYSIAQFVFALSTIFSGKLVDKKGPRLNLTVGGLLYGGGLILSSFATTPLMLYLTYGVLLGAGVGFVYVCPLFTLVQWFPRSRGTVIGVSVAVFGGGSILFKEVIAYLLQDSTVSGAFFKLGIIATLVILIGAQLVSLPSKPHPSKETEELEKSKSTSILKKPDFYKVWFMYWLAVIPGLLILGAAKNIGLQVAGLQEAAAASIITVLAVSNAGSRLLSGFLSDRFGTLNILKASFIITISALLFLSFLSSIPVFFYLGLIGVAMGYGGFLALFPTFTLKRFGPENYGANYGLIFQAYGLASLSGIFLKAMVGTYTNTFAVSAFTACLGLIIAFRLGKAR